MSVSERKGYFSRVKNSFLGVLFGIVLFLGSFVLLTWNERDAIRQTGAITEINKVALADVSADSVESGNDGKLVHSASRATTSDELNYEKFGVRENAIRLRWDSSIYQWEETKRERDDRTVYDYDRVWADSPIDSSRFRNSSSHSNLDSTQHFKDGQEQAKDVAFGAFALTKKLIDQIDAEVAYALPDSVVLDVRPAGRVSNGNFYTGDPEQPEIGDERVEVYIVGPTHDVTVMAKQSGETFQAYETKVGINKELLYMGLLSKDEVIAEQRSEAAFRRWMFRGLGFGAMWIGFAMMLGPLRSVFSFIPFVGRILGGAIGFISFFVAFGLSSITIAIAWFVVRPILSTVLLAVAAVCFFFVYRRKSEEEDSFGAPNVPPPVPPPLPNA